MAVAATSPHSRSLPCRLQRNVAGKGNKMKRLMLALAFCLAGNALLGYVMDVKVWRGEKLAVLLLDGSHEVFDCPPGISVEIGSLMPVRYNKSARSLDYAIKADRAVVGSKESGLGFAIVTASQDTKPGRYEFGQFAVTVLDRTLPPARDWKYYLDLWQHPWAVARVKGVKPFSREHYAAMEPLWKMLADAGQKTLTVTLVDQPWNHQCYDAYGSMIGRRRGADGKWSFDYSLFDEYVKFGKSCGLGPDIACYTMCPWGYMVDYVDADGSVVRKSAKPGTPFFDEYWGEFLVDFSKHLEEKGWLSNTYIAMDERSPEDLMYIAKFVRRVAPGLKIAMAGNRKPSEFKDIEIGSYSQLMGHVSKDFLGEVPARQKEGKITTYYVCCSPDKPNTFMKSGLGEAFVCGFYPAAAGLDGLLRWAYNSWGADPVNDMTYPRWTAGDVALVYGDGSPSWRFLDLRNGIVAAEKFRILREEGGHDAELNALAAKFDIKSLLNGTDYEKLRKDVNALVNK